MDKRFEYAFYDEYLRWLNCDTRPASKQMLSTEYFIALSDEDEYWGTSLHNNGYLFH